MILERVPEPSLTSFSPWDSKYLIIEITFRWGLTSLFPLPFEIFVSKSVIVDTTDVTGCTLTSWLLQVISTISTFVYPKHGFVYN